MMVDYEPVSKVLRVKWINIVFLRQSSFLKSFDVGHSIEHILNISFMNYVSNLFHIKEYLLILKKLGGIAHGTRFVKTNLCCLCLNKLMLLTVKETKTHFG